MSEKVEVNYSIGGGFLGILTLIFITLKLTGHISWSWLWVLSPLWIPLAMFLAFFGVVVCVTAIAMLLYVWLQK